MLRKISSSDQKTPGSALCAFKPATWLHISKCVPRWCRTEDTVVLHAHVEGALESINLMSVMILIHLAGTRGDNVFE